MVTVISYQLFKLGRFSLNLPYELSKMGGDRLVKVLSSGRPETNSFLPSFFPPSFAPSGIFARKTTCLQRPPTKPITAFDFSSDKPLHYLRIFPLSLPSLLRSSPSELTAKTIIPLPPLRFSTLSLKCLVLSRRLFSYNFDKGEGRATSPESKTLQATLVKLHYRISTLGLCGQFSLCMELIQIHCTRKKLSPVLRYEEKLKSGYNIRGKS